jgi:plasmid maintenance system killer protein
MEVYFRNSYLGLYSIRVDLKYRLEFAIEKNKITLLEIIFINDLSNHYR